MAPRMRPTSNLHHSSFRFGEEAVVRNISVGLQLPPVVFQKTLRPGPFARRGVVVNRGLMIALMAEIAVRLEGVDPIRETLNALVASLPEGAVEQACMV